MRPGLPIEVQGVAIDNVSIREDERFLEAALSRPHITPEGVPVTPIEAPAPEIDSPAGTETRAARGTCHGFAGGEILFRRRSSRRLSA
jgi:hypothetical protein